MATFTVTNLFNAGAGSLRNVIFKSNRKESADIIEFDTSLSGTIGLSNGELRIRDDLTINGLGADLLSVDAGGNSRVFNVDGGDLFNDLEVAIKGLTITGGDVSEDVGAGGGILNNENLTVTNSTISGNTAEGSGGGIYNDYDGTLTVTNSTVSGNSGYFGGGIAGSSVTVTNSTVSGNSGYRSGGGIHSEGFLTVTNSTISGNTVERGGGGGISGRYSTVTVSNSTISGNTAEGSGGGINNGISLTVTNSTISGNTAEGSGGGIGSFEGSDLTVSNSTISGNTVERGGGGISFENSYLGYVTGSATVTSSIIAGNTNNQDIEGDPFITGGNNLIGNGDGADGFTNGINGDLVGTAANPTEPLLGPLQDNGGLTQTQALLPGSQAINAGSNPEGLEFDQRGPGFDRVVGAQADIGAYEVPEPDSALGLLLGLPILGVILLCKHQRLKKNNSI